MIALLTKTKIEELIKDLPKEKAKVLMVSLQKCYNIFGLS